MKEINPPADAESVHVDFEVKTGPTVRLAVADPEGRAVAGASIMGLAGRGPREGEALPSHEGAATNLMPGEERSLVVLSRGRKLGKVVRVREGDDARGPVAVRLGPLATITGLVADADGQPVPRALVRSHLLSVGDSSLNLPQVMTDDQGRFIVPDVPTGCDYSLAAETMGLIADQRVAFVHNVAVRPGETTDVGEVRFEKD